MSSTVIAERVRIITAFADEQEVQPVSATAMDIMRWLNAHRDDWSDGTACTYFGYLRAWFKWLQVHDHRLDDPTIKVGAPRWPDRAPQPTPDHAVVTLLKTRMHHRTRAMILLALLVGLRAAEIAKHRGEHIDVAAGTIWVDGKGKKARTLPLHPLLAELAATMPAHGYWFPSNSTRQGTHIRSKSVSSIVNQAMRRAAVPGTLHKLRHWYGTTLLEDGADLFTVRDLLRHSSVSTTQNYVKVPDERRHAAIGRLDPFRAA